MILVIQHISDGGWKTERFDIGDVKLEKNEYFIPSQPEHVTKAQVREVRDNEIHAKAMRYYYANSK